ncbi:MAG: ATP-dependent DNA helicase RecG [Anaerolineae bacterium]
MLKPVETLLRMLSLEEKDYHFRDKAVAGGLTRYADTWLKQAREVYGEEAEAWAEGIAQDMRAYSRSSPEERPELLRSLATRLHAPPGRAKAKPKPEPESPVGEKAPDRGAGVEEAAGTREAEPPSQSDDEGLWQSVKALRGVGEKRAALLERLDVRTIRDLLFLFPRRYDDYSTLKTIDRLEYGEQVTVIASVGEAGGRRTRGGRYLFKALLIDGTGTLEVTWFNQPYLEQQIKRGMQIVVRGTVDEYLGRLTMTAPEWERVDRRDLKVARILPVYPTTEGLTSRWLRKLMRRALSAWADRVADPLPPTLRREHDLLPLPQALWGVHLPKNAAHLKAARRRLAFEEVLYLQLGLLQQKRRWKAQPGYVIEPPPEYTQALVDALPYELTEAQRRSLNEMSADMLSGKPMNRLLQGDVGSGKTVVAALLMAVTVYQGYQAALMAPTEILAEQHYQSLGQLFESFPEPRPSIRLLSGSVQGEEREDLYAQLAAGELDVVVGTHALIQEEVQFAKLAFVVIDEQHRFGVEQRGALRQKGYNPHLLVMTATPIPRSLELTIWGHLDVSVLDEMPPGRKPVKTRVLTLRELERAYGFIRSQVEKGRQAFIIYPLVEESGKIDAPSAVEAHRQLQEEVFPDLRVGLLHGRLSSEEKERVMTEFARGALDVLVATSVVEVGIDVPNASVILIDGAERFGLSQLHQFRGRVGRGEHPSYCLLLARNHSENAVERLQAMESTTDGFVLAEKDLEMRGPGEFLGTRQSGLPTLPLAMQADTRLLHEARTAAERLLEADPELQAPAHHLLAERVARIWSPEDLAGDVS